MRTFIALALVTSLAGCVKEKPADSPSQAPAHAGLPPVAAGDPAAAPAPAQPGAPAPSAGESLTGTVLERIDAPPYSYLRLQTRAGEQWAAVNQLDVKTGETVTIASAMTMDGFESKTLKRKFDKIVFGTVGSPASAGSVKVAKADVQVPKAEAADAKTIADVFANRTALKDHEVTVRGKVVKYNGGIMGKNWLHIQDGSGTEAKGDHDIAVTTTDAAKLGDTVTVRGPVHLDRDFGAGYKYAVIVEDAKLQ